MPFQKNAKPYISSASFSFSNLVGGRSKFDGDNSHFFESGAMPTPNKSQNPTSLLPNGGHQKQNLQWFDYWVLARPP